MKKRPLQGKKEIKRTPQPKKAPKSLEFSESSKKEIRSKLLELLIDSNEEEEECLPLLEVKEEVQSFFDLRKDSESLTIKKKGRKCSFCEVTL